MNACKFLIFEKKKTWDVTRILIKLATWMKVQSLWPPLRAAYGSHEARHEINSALAFDEM
jgi:hypothetical protein